MTKTTVRKHDRKGTKGVRQHSRSLPATKKVPHNKHQHKPSWKLAKTKDELTNQQYGIIEDNSPNSFVIQMPIDDVMKLMPAKSYFSGFNKNVLSMIGERYQNNLPVDPIWLVVDKDTGKVRKHEGRHRLIVAKALGIKKVPVYMTFRDYSDRIDYMDRRSKTKRFNETFYNNKFVKINSFKERINFYNIDDYNHSTGKFNTIPIGLIEVKGIANLKPQKPHKDTPHHLDTQYSKIERELKSAIMI